MSKVIFDFECERFAVTGASSGIGRQISRELAQSGAEVLAIGRNPERLSELEKEFPGKIFTASLDVCDSEKLENAIALFTSEHGKLNGGVHAAGIDYFTPLRSFDENNARDIMNVSFWAGVNFLQLITRAKFGQAGTSTVLFSSVSSMSNEKAKFAYSAAKAAVNTFVKCAAKEICAKKHRVNSILPGWVETPLTEKLSADNNADEIISRHLLGTGTPENISKMVLFLLSDAASWITGSNIVVDGGYLA